MKGSGEVEARNNNPKGSKCALCRRSRGGDQGLLPPWLPSDKRLHQLPPSFTSSTTVCHQSSEACVQVLYYCKDDSRLKTKGIKHSSRAGQNTKKFSWTLALVEVCFVIEKNGNKKNTCIWIEVRLRPIYFLFFMYWNKFFQLPEWLDGKWGHLHSYHQAMSFFRQVRLYILWWKNYVQKC